MKLLPRIIALAALCGAVAGSAAFYSHGRSIWMPAYAEIVGKRTVADVVREYGPGALSRLKPHFRKAGVAYPPRDVVFLAMKREMRLEVWARNSGPFRHVRTYEIKKTSGRGGPKLREGDRQVPEGVYRIIGLNPNSSFHLSLKIDFPNAFDLKHARREGRTEPGSDIFIHGRAVSIGCLAMGDRVIEELFVLAAETGPENFKVVIAPRDPRAAPLSIRNPSRPWVHDLYRDISGEFAHFKRK
jgi:hypothetical protein